MVELTCLERAGTSGNRICRRQQVFKVEWRKLMSVNMFCRWTHVAEAVSEHAV